MAIYCSARGSETYKASSYKGLTSAGSLDVNSVSDIEKRLYPYDPAEGVREISVETPCICIEQLRKVPCDHVK